MDKKLEKVMQGFKHDLTQLPLFQQAATSEFRRFLLSERLRPFLHLHILANYLDEQFHVVYLEKKLYRQEFTGCDEEDIYEERTEGPEHIGEFTGQQLFQFTLQCFDFLQLLPEDPAPINRFDNKTGDWFFDLNKQVLLNKHIVLTEEEVYTDKPELISGILEKQREEFIAFLEEADGVGVSHSHYITWLTKWFPGLVKIKFIETNDSTQ